MLTWGWLRCICSSTKVPVLSFLFFFSRYRYPSLVGALLKAPSLHLLVSFMPLSSLMRQFWVLSCSADRYGCPLASPRWFRVYVWIIYFIRVTAGLQLLVCNCSLLAHHKYLSGLTWSTPAGILLSSFSQSVSVCVCSCTSRQTAVYGEMKIKRKFNLFSIFNSAYSIWP